jgi:hypothetical protein
MKLHIYSVYDQCADAFIQPFFIHNDGLAIRLFQDNVNSKDDNNISKHPEQFQLYKLAFYDDNTGKIEPLDAPRILANGLDIKNPSENQLELDIDKRLQRIEKLLGNINIGKLKSEVS